MIDLLRKNISHDPADPRDRVPLGAVPTGKRIQLSLRIRNIKPPAARLVVFSDTGEQRFDLQEEAGRLYASFDLPMTPVVLWYYFELRWNDRTFYYGTASDPRVSGGEVYPVRPPAFQITVYADDFATPNWLRQGIIYQIFPDRFAHGDESTIQAGVMAHRSRHRTIFLHKSWDEPPIYLPMAGESEYRPCDFYGGTLRAISERLDYLQDLGVSIIYLNPIFEAASNHRYDTADYLSIDPLLGSSEDFVHLCHAAESRGIRILLDGVFSHTGADSIYFDRLNTYGHGAFHYTGSPFRTWYHFNNDGSYRCWWGFDTLPEVNEQEPSWQEFFISGEDSVIKHWLRQGAAGFRLDVADELPDNILRLIRQATKSVNADKALIGEVWEDATTKQSYGTRRTYALGQSLDSVMNYPLRQALINFALREGDSHHLTTFLLKQRLNYPPPLYYALMNLLSSHDVARIRSVLSSGLDPHKLTRKQQANFIISDAQDCRGAKLQYLLAVMIYSLPGVPCIYYGDEQGMQGMLDPFNRAPWQPSAHPLSQEYAQLAHIRANYDALRGGAVAFYAANPEVIAILRYITNGHNELNEPANDGCLLTLINRSPVPQPLLLDIYATHRGLNESQQQSLLEANYHQAVCLLSSETAGLTDGLLSCTIPPFGARIFTLS